MLFTWKGNPFDINYVKQRIRHIVQNGYEITACTDLFIHGKKNNAEATYHIELLNKKSNRKNNRLCFGTVQLNKRIGEKHYDEDVITATYDNETYLSLLKKTLSKKELDFWTFLLIACLSTVSLFANINFSNSTLFYVARIVILVGSIIRVFRSERNIVFIIKTIKATTGDGSLIDR